MNVEAMECNMSALEKREEIEKGVITVQSEATSIVIIDNETYLQAGALLVGVKQVRKNIEDYFKPLKETSYKSWKQICNRENEEIEKLTPAINHLNNQMTAWYIAQENIRWAEEERLRQEALKAEEERKLQDALQAEKEGDKETAEAILEEPTFVPPPIVERSVPKIAGQTMTTTWKWRLKDINLVPRQYLQVNETAVNGVVRSLKNQAKIAGIEVYEEKSIRSVRS